MLLTEENTAEGKHSFVLHKMKELIHHVNRIPHQNISLICYSPLLHTKLHEQLAHD